MIWLIFLRVSKTRQEQLLRRAIAVANMVTKSEFICRQGQRFASSHWRLYRLQFQAMISNIFSIKTTPQQNTFYLVTLLNVQSVEIYFIKYVTTSMPICKTDLTMTPPFGNFSVQDPIPLGISSVCLPWGREVWIFYKKILVLQHICFSFFLHL